MKKILIENAQVGISKGGFACGPIGGHVVAEVQIRVEDAASSYYGMAEIDGMANFYTSAESRFEMEIEEDYEDEFPVAEGYEDYTEFYDALPEMLQEDEAHALLLKYIVYLVRADWDEIEAMKKMSIGKYIGEFDIPICDEEADYLEAAEEECEDEEDFNPMAAYGTGESNSYSPQLIALLVAHPGGHFERPYPRLECAIEDADRMWNEMSDAEKAKHIRFRIARGEFYYSMGGPLFIESELIKDYLAD